MTFKDKNEARKQAKVGDAAQQVRALITARSDQLRVVIPPSLPHLAVERIGELAGAVVARNPSLRKCTPASVFMAIYDSLSLGLDPLTPALGHAYLVPFKDQATFMLGYKGMIELMMRSPAVDRVIANVVYQDELETFHCDPAACEIRHPWSPNVKREDDLLVAAYALAYLKGQDRPVIRILSRDELLARRQRSQAFRYADGKRKDSAWHTDYAAMCRKTAVRALGNMGVAPLATTAAVAMAKDQAIEEADETKLADFEVLDEPGDVEVVTIDGVDYTEDMVSEDQWAEWMAAKEKKNEDSQGA